MISYDGDNKYDKKLWQTYLHWAKRKAQSNSNLTSVDTGAICDDPKKRVEESLDIALQTIIFSAFTLEYRLKRVALKMGVPFREKDSLGVLLGHFWKKLEKVRRWDKKGKCSPPSEWKSCKNDLDKLVELRNNIAHANYKKVTTFFSIQSDPKRLANQYYNAVVEDIKLINIGTGAETRSKARVEKYFKPLRA
jgi:hypothetical protein